MSTQGDQDHLGAPVTFRHDAEHQADEAGAQRMMALLDLQDASPAVVRLRQWALAAGGPTAGETAVDVGSGTGSATRLLDTAVGEDGRAVGVEPNPLARAEAERRAVREGSAATFTAGVAGALPFDDATVDVVWCERVLQHLDDSQGAVDEMARVLRSGGRALVLDSDHATRITSDVDYEVEAKLNATFLAMAPNPRAARRLPRQLRDAGLVVDGDVGSAALVVPTGDEQASLLIRVVVHRAVESGVISETEGSAALASYLGAAEERVAFSSVTMFAFVARKP